jgi:phenylacetate-CoA ligase
LAGEGSAEETLNRVHAQVGSIGTLSYQWLYENIGYRLQDLAYGRHVIRTLRELRDTQWLPEQELLRQQWQLLKQVLHSSYAHVPFHRDRFSKLGLTPADIRTWDDMAQIPPLTKDDLQEHFDDLVADQTSEFRMIPARTGGSTGKPTDFYLTSTSADYVAAATFRNAEWAGWRLGVPYAYISGSHYDISRAKRLRTRVRAHLMRRQNLPAAKLSREDAEAHFSAIRRFRPRILWGYASAVYALAQFAKDLNQTEVSFESVITSSDTLFDHQRLCIERVFGCEVFDLYGSREFHIAGECEKHEGYHIAAESVFVEVVDKSNARTVGSPGRVLVTDLRNRGFPFIRYEIGDIAVRSTHHCTCGRGLPLLDSVSGRISDFIVTPSGKVIPPPAFTVPLTDTRTVSQYQVIQRHLRSVEVQLVCTPEFSEADLARITVALADILGEEVRLSFQFVDSIDRGVSGKRRIVISNVRPDSW